MLDRLILVFSGLLMVTATAVLALVVDQVPFGPTRYVLIALAAFGIFAGLYAPQTGRKVS